MPRRSAGLLPFQVERRGGAAVLRVLLVHPGGPFWAKKDAGAWSICKGELDEGEDPRSAALREFEEELGRPPPSGAWVELGELTQPSGKRVRAWAVEGDVDVRELHGNEIEIEWPPRSGARLRIPEVDRAEWFDLAEARQRILKGQAGFLDALVQSAHFDPRPSEGRRRDP